MLKFSSTKMSILGLSLLFSPMAFMACGEINQFFGSYGYLVCIGCGVFYLFLSEAMKLLFSLLGRKTPFAYLEFFIGEAGTVFAYSQFILICGILDTVLMNVYNIDLLWRLLIYAGILFIQFYPGIKSSSFFDFAIFVTFALRVVLFLIDLLYCRKTPLIESTGHHHEGPFPFLKIFFVLAGVEAFFALAHLCKPTDFNFSVNFIVIAFTFWQTFILFLIRSGFDILFIGRETPFDTVFVFMFLFTNYAFIIVESSILRKSVDLFENFPNLTCFYILILIELIGWGVPQIFSFEYAEHFTLLLYFLTVFSIPLIIELLYSNVLIGISYLISYVGLAFLLFDSLLNDSKMTFSYIFFTTLYVILNVIFYNGHFIIGLVPVIVLTIVGVSPYFISYLMVTYWYGFLIYLLVTMALSFSLVHVLSSIEVRSKILEYI